MKLAVKLVKWAIVPVIVLLVVLCVALCFFGGYILKVGIETAATKALNVGVDIDGLDISLLKSTVEINGLIVRNPPGYTYENLLELVSGRVTASVTSLLKDTVRIKELRLNGINLVIEQKALSNNLHDIVSSIAAGDKRESEPSGKKLQIDELEITDIKVKVKLLPVPGKADTVTLQLSPIKMSNLGTDNKLTTGILASKIMLAIADGVAKQGVGILPEEIVNTMKSTLGKVVDLSETASKEGKKLIDTGKDVGTKVIDSFKGLLKSKKEE